MSLDVTDAIREWAGTTTVYRRGATATVGADGFATPAAETAVEIRAMLQPASGRVLDRLPEGRRERETIQVFSLDEIRTVDRDAGLPADVVSYQGRRWEVQDVTDWGARGGYWDALAQLEVDA